jgi:hypothetical protein
MGSGRVAGLESEMSIIDQKEKKQPGMLNDILNEMLNETHLH